MHELVNVGVDESGLSPVSICRAVLAGVPGGGAVIFDHRFRVKFAEGNAVARAGTGPMVGRVLADLMPAAAWRVLRGPYEAALAGRTTRFEFASAGTLLSILVSPIDLPGAPAGGLAVAHEAGGEPLRTAFDHAPIGMTVIDLEGRWLMVNDACCAMLGYRREALIGRTFTDVMHPDDVAEDRRLFAATIAGAGDTPERDKRYRRTDGSVVWLRSRSQLVRDPAGAPLYVVAHLQDISERRVAQEQRRSSDLTLRSVIDNTPAVICVKGRDHRYQLVNRQFEDWCGVPSERILGRSAEEMPWATSTGGRVKDQSILDGGESVSEEETVLSRGRLRVFLTTRFPLRDEHGTIHAVCAASTDITERRDEELAKRERLQSSELIYAALAQDRLVLHGQPILNLASMQVEQAELLVRMFKDQDRHELLAPGAFLPAAERFDLIGLIDHWVVDRAVELAAAGHRVEVNLSAKTISDPGGVDRIERAVLASGAPPRNLIFEITETAAADNLGAAREFASRLRALGCAFALDDFGVGHGTFTYLKHLPVDYLKIDLQFVSELLSDTSNRDVVQAIIGVAKQFAIQTVAEGVEDQATLEELVGLGADYAQGYWIGRPTPLGQLWTPEPPDETGGVTPAR